MMHFRIAMTDDASITIVRYFTEFPERHLKPPEEISR